MTLRNMFINIDNAIHRLTANGMFVIPFKPRKLVFLLSNVCFQCQKKITQTVVWSIITNSCHSTVISMFCYILGRM